MPWIPSDSRTATIASNSATAVPATDGASSGLASAAWNTLSSAVSGLGPNAAGRTIIPTLAGGWDDALLAPLMFFFFSLVSWVGSIAAERWGRGGGRCVVFSLKRQPACSSSFKERTMATNGDFDCLKVRHGKVKRVLAACWRMIELWL